MPNWCYNDLIVKKNDADNYILDSEKRVDFSILVPEPNSKDECDIKYIITDNEIPPIEIDDDKPWFNWYHWHINEWGTKWNARRTCVSNKANDEYIISFETPWGPPVGWLKALAEKGIKFHLDWKEETGYKDVITNETILEE